MGKIKVLDIGVANLIAAGEVVDRPASALKELLENSIDAEATKITVEIKRGGLSLMRITDNGCGMSREDALICTKRHATSKIRSASDLDGIATLGFRGEALAAISSVSNMRIMTKTADSEIGTIIECAYGEIKSVGDAGCPDGTTIVIEELFANFPVRRKFIRNDAHETGLIIAVVEKIAISRPNISVKLITDGRIRFQTVGDGNLRNTIYAVLGREFSENLVEIHDQTDSVEVFGYISTPEGCRKTRVGQNYFLNGRYVRCATASAALEQAYTSYLPAGKYPCCVIKISVNPAFVDVNVHPQKMEIKFANEKPIFNAVYCAARNSLSAKLERPSFGETKLTGDSYKLYSDIMDMKTATDEEADKIADEKEKLSRRYEQVTIPNPEPYTEIKDGVAVLRTGGQVTSEVFGKQDIGEGAESEYSGAGGDKAESRERDVPSGESAVQSDTQGTLHNKDGEGGNFNKVTYTKSEEPTFDSPYEVTNEAENTDLPAKNNASDKETSAEENTLSNPAVPYYRIAGVMFECYVLVELEDRMLIIDKHAAHERIIFEGLKANMKKMKPISQLLLIPIEAELTDTEYAALNEYKDEINKIGFEFGVGEAGITEIYRIPSGLTSREACDMLCELAYRISEGMGDVAVSREMLCEKALYQASCKAALKGGRADSSEADINWIVRQVLTRNDIRYCPHGRPIALEMTKAQFENRFERT